MPSPGFATTEDSVDALFAPAARRGGGAGRGAGGAGGSASPAASAASSSASAQEQSKRYKEKGRLDFEEKLVDGFCDHVAEGVIVDRANDDRLANFLRKAEKLLRKASDAVTAVMVMGLLVSEFCGRSGQHAENLDGRFRELMRGRKGVHLGDLLGEESSKKRKGASQGACPARHRALLFKCLADSLGGAECTLEREGGSVVVWNSVRLEQAVFVVDLVHDPGALYESGSPKMLEYGRLLQPGAPAQFLTTISCRGELAGRVPRPPWHVEDSELACGRGEEDQLGKGGFGEVFRGGWAGVSVAIKVVKDKDPSELNVMDFVLEIALLSRLNHPNVMRFWRGCVEISNGQRTLLMVTENIARGGLSGLLHGHGGATMVPPLDIGQSLWLALGIARGMQYLHACSVLHLDLKSPNVLVDEDWTPKLCDFGLAKITARDTGDGMQTTLRGVSPIWAPPEMFDDRAEDMTDKADVYSYGIVVFEIVNRQLPFSEVNPRQLPKAKFEGVLPALPKAMPEDCGALVSACCVARPSSRPSMRALVARLNDAARARGLQLETVTMPPWTATSAVSPEARDEGLEGAMRELRARREKLETERRRAQKQLAEMREQRRRVQEAHLGKGLSTAEVGPMQFAADGAAAGGSAGGAGAGGGGVASTAAAAAGSAAAGAKGGGTSSSGKTDEKKCCDVM
eukprot:TRINITY_DN15778_c0_g3_i1.p1 TRINITY_DN15778_c0_g3~~TRINITY_DN15778_c0_g3_i1.p1  ORF type:complete len:685 (-),score=165.69 TRINITY_DN15778_c0_g3_i1:76-2130(-)